jgi:hypothetical protein
MGRILSRGCPKDPIHFLILQFLCSTWQPFLRPDPHTECGRRAQERARLAVHWAATDRLGLDGSEHDGILVVVGMTTSEGSSHVVREHSRHILLFGGAEDPDHDAVMRIGSESSEAADPF